MPEIVSSFADTAAPAPNLVATRVAASIRLRAESRRGVRSGSTAPAELSLKAVAHGAALVESGVALEPSPCPLEWLAAARADLPMQAEGPTPGRAAVRVAAAFPLRSECHHKVPSDWRVPAELSSQAVAHEAAPIESGADLHPPPVLFEWLAGARADGPMTAGPGASARAQGPAQVESTPAQVGLRPLGAEALAGRRAVPVMPQETMVAVPSDPPVPAGAGVALRADGAIMIEALAGALAEGASCEFLSSPRARSTPPLEASVIALVGADAAAPLEALGSVQGDGAAGSECRGTYIVAVTLTLSDGRVLTFPAVPCGPSV